MSSPKRKFESKEAQYWANKEIWDMAEAAEKLHLNCNGRVMGHDDQGKITANGPGYKIDGAKLQSYSVNSRSFIIRVDHTAIPGFWMEIEVPYGQLMNFRAEEPGKLYLNCNGRVMGYNDEGKITVNGPGNKIDGVKLQSYNVTSGLFIIRVDHTTIPGFWMEIEVPYGQSMKFMEEEAEEQGTTQEQEISQEQDQQQETAEVQE